MAKNKEKKEAGNDLFAKLRRLKALKDQKKLLEASVSKINEELETIQAEAFEQMQTEGLGKVSVDGSTFFPASRLFFGFGENEDDRGKGIDWIKKNHPELMSVNSQTMTSFFSTEMKENPKFKLPAYFRQTSKEYIGIRTASEK